MFVYIFLILFTFLFYCLRKNYYYWQHQGVPCKPPFLFFGNVFNVVAQKESIFESIRTIYFQYNTPYVGLHIFTIPFLMLKDPKLIKTALVRDFDKFMDRGTGTNEVADPIAFHSLFTAEGQIWKSLRHKLSPVFSTGKIKLMFPIMEECAKKMNTYLANRDGKIIDVKTVTKKYTVDIISSCAFGVDGNCWLDEDSDMTEMATRLADLKSIKRNMCIFSFFFIPTFVKIFRLKLFDSKATDFLLGVFQHSLKTRNELKIVRNDFIDLINNLKEEEQFSDTYKFDDIKMASQAIFFFAAGNDTSSITMLFALYELALNKDIQNNLREEIKSVFDDEEHLSYEQIQKMKYLDMVICETLRKYPVIAFLNRKTTQNYTFEDTGLTLDQGANVLIPIIGLHYDPNYFPEPEKFDPERFNDKNVKSIKPYVYLPFGEGPRNCIGQRFALLSLKVGLAYIFKDFMLELPNQERFNIKFDPKSFLLQSTDKICVKITKL